MSSRTSDSRIPRYIKHYGRALRPAAADDGYVSEENLETAKQKKVKMLPFIKKGFAILDMVKSPWVYRKLRISELDWHAILAIYHLGTHPCPKIHSAREMIIHSKLLEEFKTECPEKH